jgi:hypothetical protein
MKNYKMNETKNTLITLIIGIILGIFATLMLTPTPEQREVVRTEVLIRDRILYQTIPGDTVKLTEYLQGPAQVSEVIRYIDRTDTLWIPQDTLGILLDWMSKRIYLDTLQVTTGILMNLQLTVHQNRLTDLRYRISGHVAPSTGILLGAMATPSGIGPQFLWNHHNIYFGGGLLFGKTTQPTINFYWNPKK